MKQSTILLFLCLACHSIFSQSIQLTITGISELKGTIYVGIYKQKQGFTELDATYISRILVVDNSFVKENIELPQGKYAITAFHDRNSNGILDKNFLGIPVETYGFSNNVRAMFSAPAYEDCLVDVQSRTELVIELK